MYVHRLVLAVLVGLMLTSEAMATPAAPDDATTPEDVDLARSLFKKAEVHFTLREFHKALGLYKNAYRITPLPGFLFNIGQCYRLIGRCDEALFFYKQYLERSPNARQKTEVERLIGMCNKKLEQASRPGFAGRYRLTRGPRGRGSPIDLEDTPSAEQDRVWGEHKRSLLHTPWKIAFWSGLTLSTALFVTGAVTGVIALNKNREYKDPTTSVNEREVLKDSGEEMALVSTVTLGAGGAALLGSVLVYWLAPKQRENTPEISAAPLPGGGLLLLQRSF